MVVFTSAELANVSLIHTSAAQKNYVRLTHGTGMILELIG